MLAPPFEEDHFVIHSTGMGDTISPTILTFPIMNPKMALLSGHNLDDWSSALGYDDRFACRLEFPASGERGFNKTKSETLKWPIATPVSCDFFKMLRSECIRFIPSHFGCRESDRGTISSTP